MLAGGSQSYATKYHKNQERTEISILYQFRSLHTYCFEATLARKPLVADFTERVIGAGGFQMLLQGLSVREDPVTAGNTLDATLHRRRSRLEGRVGEGDNIPPHLLNASRYPRHEDTMC